MKGVEERPPGATVPHVLILPCPAQGHVNVMLKLAELLALSNFHVTFLNTDHIHHRLTLFSDVQSRFSSRHGGLIQFKAISNGYLLDHPRERFNDVLQSFNVSARRLLRNMLDSDELCSESLGKPRVNCIIGDGILGKLTSDIGDELEIPVIHFRTISSGCFWDYFCVPRLFESGELPIRVAQARRKEDANGMTDQLKTPTFICGDKLEDGHGGRCGELVGALRSLLNCIPVVITFATSRRNPIVSNANCQLQTLPTFFTTVIQICRNNKCP